MILLLLITNFFLDRETNIVHVFHADTAEWTFQENKLPKPLFSHGCNLVTLKDGRSGILTVGGFTTEGIPAVIPNTNNTIFQHLCPVHLTFEMLLLASNVEIVVDFWMFIYFLLFCLGKFNQN